MSVHVSGFFVLVAIAMVTVVSAGLNTAVCVPFTNNGGRDFPEIPNNFVAKFTLNDRQLNASMYVEEFYSQDADLGSMFITGLCGPDIVSQFISNGKTGEKITICNVRYISADNNCDVRPMASNDDTTFPFKPSTQLNSTSKDVLMSGKTVLMFGATDGLLQYNGTKTINGLDVDIWLGCLYDSNTDNTIQATYYFSQNDSTKLVWNTASGIQSIKRVDVQGMNSQNKGPFNLTYDYVYFDDEIPDADWETKFETPIGIYCPGRQSTKSLPSVPTYFSFQAEILDPLRRIATYTDEWYDFRANYSRMDFIDYSGGPTSSQPVRIINDFSTGVSYVIDPSRGSCSAAFINPEEFDSEAVGTNLTRMRSPKEFFSFDNNERFPWIYNGRRRVRDIASDAWTSYRPYPTSDSTYYAIWEWYFSADNWKLVDENLVEVNEPLRLIITGQSSPEVDYTKIIYNIYRFNEEEPDGRAFDVSNCFNADHESRSFEFRVLANVKKYGLDSNVVMLRYLTILSLEEFAQVRSLRIQDVEFEFADSAFLVRFTILGPAPISGDVKRDYVETSLADSVAYLQSAMDLNQFIIGWVMADNKQVFFPAEAGSYVEIGRHVGSNSVYYIDDVAAATTPVPAVSLSSGAAVGVGIGMAVVGFVGVAAPYYFIWRRRKAPAL